jgi:hypothetical protein
MITLSPHFERDLAKAGLSKVELARRSGVGRSTLFAIINPDTQPNRTGGVRDITAWKIARLRSMLAPRRKKHLRACLPRKIA